MLKVSALIAMIGLAGATGVASAQEKRDAEPDVDSFITAVRAGLDDQLVDYSSALFRNVQITADATYLCGEVNSRNEAGRMSGWSSVEGVTDPDGRVRATISGDGHIVETVGRRCGGPDALWLPKDFSGRLVAH